MSPLAEKLNVILEDRERLNGELAEVRKATSGKEEIIFSLQQQVNSLQQTIANQAAELTELREEMHQMNEHLDSVLLSSCDPEDARLKSRVDELYAGISVKPGADKPANGNSNGNGQSHSGSTIRVTVATGAAQLAAALSPSTLSPIPARAVEVSMPVSRSNGNAQSPIRVARTATPSPRI